MNKKLVIAGPLSALAAAFSLVPVSAAAAIIQLTATGTIDGGTIYDGTTNVTVPAGTSLTVTFLIDTDVFPTGVVGGSGETVYNPAGGGGCRSGVGQDPLQSSMMGATVTVGGVTLQSQAAGNQRNCDVVVMDDQTDVGDYLSIQQDAYDQQRVYYVDGDLTTVSPTETLYHITETRIQWLGLGANLDGNPFSPDEPLSELAQTFMLNSFYGATLYTEFGRGRYICSDPGGAGYRCVNEPLADGAQYGLHGIITGLEGTVVPTPGHFATALAGAGGALYVARLHAAGNSVAVERRNTANGTLVGNQPFLT